VRVNLWFVEGWFRLCGWVWLFKLYLREVFTCLEFVEGLLRLLKVGLGLVYGLFGSYLGLL